MKKLFIVYFLTLLAIILTPRSVFATSYVSETSAHFTQFTPSPTSAIQMPDTRGEKLLNFLQDHSSPLAPFANLIIEAADKHQIPWTLIVAISGVESGFCRAVPKNSYNCWGWNNGRFYFKDYQDGIEIVSKNLRLKYFDRGLNTPEKMNHIYAPPSTSWAGRVRHFMEQIESYISPSFLAIPLSF